MPADPPFNNAKRDTNKNTGHMYSTYKDVEWVILKLTHLIKSIRYIIECLPQLFPIFFFLLFKKTAQLHAYLHGLITKLAFSGSQASGLCAYPVLLFLNAAYYEPEVYTGVALSEIMSREMCTRKCGYCTVCVFPNTRVFVYSISAVLLLIFEFTLSPSQKCDKINVRVCV